MAGRLLAAGCAEAPALEAADLIVINTCAIREAAEQKVIGRQGQLARLKQANPGMRVVMTGCAVREPDRAGLRKRVPGGRPVPPTRRGAGARRSAGPRVGAGAGRDPVRGDDRRRADARRRGGSPARDAGRRGRERRRPPRVRDRRLAADHLRLRQDLHLLHRAVQPRPGAQPAVRRDRRRGPLDRRRRLPRGHAARPERQLVRPRPGRRSRASPTSTPSAGRAAASTSTAGRTSRR